MWQWGIRIYDHGDENNSIRYLDFHLKHSQGKLFQYINAHVNDYAQVMTSINVIHDETVCSSTESVSNKYKHKYKCHPWWHCLQFNWVRFMSGTKHLPGSVHGDETFLQFSPNYTGIGLFFAKWQSIYNRPSQNVLDRYEQQWQFLRKSRFKSKM